MPPTLAPGASAPDPLGYPLPPIRLNRWSRTLLACWRLLRGLLLPALAVLLAAVVPPVVAFGFPSQSAPVRADVVFVIGPPDAWRVEWARELAEQGLVSAVMISVPDAAAVDACAEGSLGGVPVLCERPDPFTTQGEARWLRAEMSEHGWSTATVITVTPHVLRTRLYFERCVPEGVNVVGRATGLTTVQQWFGQVLYQLGGLMKATFVTTGC